MNEQILMTVENLKKNNMNAFYAENKQDALEIVKTLIKDGDTVSCGGSSTIKEVGVIDLLKNGSYKFLNRSAPGLSKEDVEKIFRDSFSCDAYFSSSNAITLSGELYNVDGNSNRVAAICFGPKKVIIIAGKNKIVKDIDGAIKRVKSCAAPKNAKRLGLDTYCSKFDCCMSPEIGKGCKCESRICCSYVVSGFQRIKDRINVIIVDEELGY